MVPSKNKLGVPTLRLFEGMTIMMVSIELQELKKLN